MIRLIYAAAIGLCLCTSVSAQSSTEFASDGAYLTAPVRKALDQVRSEQFLKAASSVGFSKTQTDLVEDALRKGKLGRLISTGSGQTTTASDWKQTLMTPRGNVTTNTLDQASLIEHVVTFIPSNAFFERYATIHVIVIPIPPRDYKLVINGEDCPPTEQSTYKVLPGKATVAVSRTGKIPCGWSGEVSGGQQQKVDCKL